MALDIKRMATAQALSVAPYQAGTPISEVARTKGIPEAKIIKLASNENPLGMSPVARDELNRSGNPARYPDPDCYALRQALGRHAGVDPGHIVAGAGTSELLVLIARAFLAEGRSAVIPQYSFTVYESATKSVGARPIVVPAKDYGHDLDAMAAAIDDTTSVVFIASPNNPTGTMLTPEALERFFGKVPPHVVIVFDEAYREYLEPSLRPDVTPWLARFPNLVALRTFSKIYGLAGLRVGYAMADPALAEIIQRLRSPFSVSSLSQAVACAALTDIEFVEKSSRLNAVELKRVEAALDGLAVTYVPSHANFVLIKTGKAMETFKTFVESGIIVRPMGSWGLPDWIRVTIGTEAENDAFLAAMGRFIRGEAPQRPD